MQEATAGIYNDEVAGTGDKVEVHDFFRGFLKLNATTGVQAILEKF